MKKLKGLGILLFFVLVASSPLLAQEEAAVNPIRANLYKLSIIVGGAIITLAVAAGAFCQAKSISSACEGISRNPGAGPHIRFLLIFGLVLIETLVIYALLITIIIILIQWGNWA
ncbi:MAG: ATP synthase F0 subunit C [Candidatus Aminicenantes bacterium]|nr:ATP synthase F0 subunit C [Candidatus Aminicenantes bacterium]